MRSKPLTIAYFFALTLFMAVVVPAFWRTASPGPFFYDEADYMYAGTRGVLDNYLDRPSLSAPEFIRKGLELARDGSRRADMSQYVRASGDITFYRHYHGPMYAYWIALCQMAGAREAGAYRASGLLIHILSATLIFWMFRLVFPAYTAIAAFLAALTFLMNRTALVTATAITQHVLYILFCALTLFLMALFCRTLNRRYWYGAAAALGLAFATVETSFVLLGAVLLTLLLAEFRSGWKNLGLLLARGALVCLTTILLVWPKGILQLGVLKGYLYLAYMALGRRTLSPIGSGQLWAFKLRVYPLEFVIPTLAIVAALMWWRKLSGRREILPFLIYACLFIAATMVVTLPYTHYHGSLLMSSAVLVGAMFGELWLRRNLAIRIALPVILVATLVGMTVQYYGETAKATAAHSYQSDLLSYLDKSEGTAARTLYVPFTLVATIHFYHPELATAGYDTDWSPASLTKKLLEAGPKGELVCVESVCNEVRARFPALDSVRKTQISTASEDPREEPIYSLRVEKGY